MLRLQTLVDSTVYRAVLRLIIITLVCSAVTVFTVLKYTTDDGLRAPVVTIRISPSDISQLSGEQVSAASASMLQSGHAGMLCSCGQRVQLTEKREHQQMPISRHELLSY